jgi:hypothetical protein
VTADGTTADGSSLIDEIVREGARRMPAAALEAEVHAYMVELVDQRDEKGHRLVVRNGYHQPRKVTMAAGVRLRTEVTRGAGSGTAALAMVFELVESAQQRWLAVNAPHLVALVRAGARFERGPLVERPEVVAA